LGISITGPGVTIKELAPDSAAKGSDLKVGDQIIAVEANGVKEPVDSMFDLISYLSTLDYQTKVQLTVKRGEEEVNLDIFPKFKLSSAYATK
jgi:S1-C subfamily serine protease